MQELLHRCAGAETTSDVARRLATTAQRNLEEHRARASQPTPPPTYPLKNTGFIRSYIRETTGKKSLEKGIFFVGGGARYGGRLTRT